MNDVYKFVSPLLIMLGVFLIFGIKITVGVLAIVLGVLLWVEKGAKL
jgi:hypothetical protein